MMQSITTQNVKGKCVFVRVDVDVELAPDGKTIANDFKLRAQLPTITWLQNKGAKIILAGHYGRPDGKRDMRYSVSPAAKAFSRLLKQNVRLLGDCVGDEVEDDVLRLRAEDVCMLENLRFHKGEMENDTGFAKRLARLANVYVNDAFNDTHRPHASMVALTKLLPAYAGMLLEREVAALSKVLKKPKKPLVLIIGGAKIETKVPVIRNFLTRASCILVGGAVANTFLAAKGYRTEASKIEKEFVTVARRLVGNRKLMLPVDVVASPNPHGVKRVAFRDVQRVARGEMMLDIGPKTLQRFCDAVGKAGTVVWNGPLGLFEIPAFSHGTYGIARAIAKSSAYKVVGGGETGVVLKNLHLEDAMDHISTGGGALLEFLAGKKLPGLAALGYYRKNSMRL